MRPVLLIAVFAYAICVPIVPNQNAKQSWADDGSSDGRPPERLSLPDATALDDSRKLVEDVFKDECERAKTPTAKKALAEELLEKGADKTETPATRFVLLTRAKDVASQVCDGFLAFQAVDKLAVAFEIDATAMQIELLKTLAKAARTPDEHESVTEQAIELFHKMRSAEKYDKAEEIIRIASAEAARTRDKNLAERVRTCRKDVENAIKHLDEIEAAKQKLKNSPDDPQSNLILGRYLCFIKAEWQTGLLHLAKGSDRSLNRLATVEQNVPADAETKMALADGWWEQAQSVQGDSQKNVLRHAGQWYEKALPSLSGLTKYKAEKRLATIKESDVEPTIAGRDDYESVLPQASGGTIPWPDGVIPKRLDGQVRLDRAHGPYKVEGAVTVSPNAKLSIERGTVILCSPGAKILVAGEIGSFGEGERFVMFRREIQDKSWNSLAFAQKSKRIAFERFDIRGAEFGIYVDRSPIEAKDCIFAQNTCGVKIYHQKEKDQTFKNCLIARNTKDGLQLDSSPVNLQHCTVADNGEAAVETTSASYAYIASSEISGNAIGIEAQGDDSEVEMHYCNILNNHAAIEANKRQWKCEHNYWDTADGRQILASLGDSRSRQGAGASPFESAAARPFADAGCTLKLNR